jgi:hypothetical protein
MSQENLADVPTEDVEVQKQHTPVTSKIGSKEFNEELIKELSDGKPWRTAKGLATKFNVDAKELDAHLLKGLEEPLCYRKSKEDGVFLYAILKRVEQEKPARDPKVEAALRPIVTEEDRYALASLHSSFILLDAALHKYAMKIHERNSEAFTNLVQGKDKIEAGIALLASKLKSDVTKLPKV